MPVQRHVFPFDTDTGVQTLTSASAWGAVLQTRWSPTTGDTGGDLILAVLPDRVDTGLGWEFYNDNDILGTGFTRVPRQSINTNLDGTLDTGDAPVVLAGDRIQAKVVPGGAAVVGTLYVWTGSV